MIAAIGVSRTVVREAVAALKADRLVVTRQRVGAFVADHVRRPFRVDFDERSPLHEVINVMELRTGVEAEAAGLAAQRASPTQVKKIADRYARSRQPSAEAMTRSIRTSPFTARSPMPPVIRNSAVSSNISAVPSSRGARSGHARRRRQSENSSICFSMSTRRSSRRSAITPSPRRATPCSGTSSTAAPATRRSPPKWGSSSVFRGPGAHGLKPSRCEFTRARVAAGAARSPIFFLVFHRALPDLQRMKLCHSVAASSASRSVFAWCD